jgi:Tol biopolymer transport system component
MIANIQGTRPWTVLLLAAIAAGAMAPAASAAPATTVRVSVATDGAQANRDSTAAVISADGDTVAFDSTATNLSRRADTNHAKDVFVRDLATGVTRRVSVTDSGAQARGTSHVIAISSNGNLVLFSSTAANLVPGDRNGQPDVFVRDVARRTTRRVDLGPGGIEPEGVQPNFPGCCAPFGLDMSPDGRFVLYAAGDPNLLHGRCCLGIFLRDRRAHTTVTIAIANNFVAQTSARVSDGGRIVAYSLGGRDFTDFPGRTSVLDRKTGKRTRIGADVGDGSIVADIAGGGRYVLFTSYLLGTDSSEVFLLDRRTGRTTHVNVSAAAPYTTRSQAATVSSNGRFVTFVSRYAGCVASDTNGRLDVFRRDLLAATTARVSLSAAGAQLIGNSSGGSMPADGRSVLFFTGAAAVAGDTNSARDVFLRR